MHFSIGYFVAAMAFFLCSLALDHPLNGPIHDFLEVVFMAIGVGFLVRSFSSPLIALAAAVVSLAAIYAIQRHNSPPHARY